MVAEVDEGVSGSALVPREDVLRVDVVAQAVACVVQVEQALEALDASSADFEVAA